LFLFIFTYKNNRILSKQYYIDFIGPSKIETIQNIKNDTINNISEKDEKVKKTININEKKEEKKDINFDQDDFFKDSSNLKPSLASQNPKLFTENNKNEGNNIKNNGNGSGINTDSDFPYPWYITQIRELLWEEWNKRMPTTNILRCVIKFGIMRNGEIENIELEKSSGNRLFDRAAISAVESIKKFPPLPDDFFENKLNIHVEFKNTNQ